MRGGDIKKIRSSQAARLAIDADLWGREVALCLSRHAYERRVRARNLAHDHTLRLLSGAGEIDAHAGRFRILHIFDTELGMRASGSRSSLPLGLEAATGR